MKTAKQTLLTLHTEFKTLRWDRFTEARVFHVYGWPLAIIRNGDAWDLLSPYALTPCVREEDLAECIREIVTELEAENASGWDFDPAETVTEF